jgi:hypothetical protein
MFYFLLTRSYLSDKLKLNNNLILELSPILGHVMIQNSVKKLDSNVQTDLRSFIRGMLCSENDRIRLDGNTIHNLINKLIKKKLTCTNLCNGIIPNAMK